METLEIKVPDKQAAKKLLLELKKRSDVVSAHVVPATIDEVTLVSEASLAKDWLSPEDEHWDDVYKIKMDVDIENKTMNAKNTLFKLLQWAMIEMRYEAVETKNNKIFAIAHTLHNLPIMLSQAETEEEYEAILAEIEIMISGNAGLTGLLNHVKRSPSPETDERYK